MGCTVHSAHCTQLDTKSFKIRIICVCLKTAYALKYSVAFTEHQNAKHFVTKAHNTQPPVTLSHRTSAYRLIAQNIYIIAIRVHAYP